MTTFSRRSFFKTAGVATGAAAISASPSLATAMPALQTAPSGPIPREPVIAIVRDAGRGEVTVLSRKTERTYRDRVLVRRILKAAQSNHAAETEGVA
jgi:hypothetical protein